MKIKEGFILREIAGSFVVVPVGQNLVDFSSMITLNETGAFLWKQIELGADEELVVKALMDEYEVDEETAKEDVKEFINLLIYNGLIENE